MNARVDELERLQRLRESGVLTDEEFQAEKRRVLAGQARPSARRAPEPETNRNWLWIALAAAGLIVAIAAGIFLGREVGPKSEEPVAGDQGVEINLSDEVLNVVEPQEDVRTLPPEEQARRAFAAAFGTGDGAGIAIDGERVEFTPGGLLWTTFGPVLISEGEVRDAARAASGKIAVHYLRVAPGGFEVAHSFVPAVEAGSSGRIGSWSVSRKFSDNPVIYTTGSGSAQGTTCSWATLTELAPSGPRTLVRVPMAYSNAGAAAADTEVTDVKGRIGNVVKGKSFDVDYSGTKEFAEHYVKSGGSYSIENGESLMETC